MGEGRHSTVISQCQDAIPIGDWFFTVRFFIRPAGLMILVCFLLTYALKLHHCHYYFHTNSKQCVVVVSGSGSRQFISHHKGSYLCPQPSPRLCLMEARFSRILLQTWAHQKACLYSFCICHQGILNMYCPYFWAKLK